jgi:hypothetical protein
MNTEIWKEINNFSKYEISNYGNLKNKDTQKILHSSIKSGYLCTSLTDNNGIRKPVRIHRLVALNFIPNVENKETVNHINHNRLDNNIKNLEWMTTTEQNNHKRKCKKEIQELVSSRAVWRIDKDTNKKLELYQTIRFASQWVFDNKLTSITDFNNGNNIKTKICAVCQKKYQRNTAFGYKWEYCNENVNKYIYEEWKDIPCEIVNNVNGYKISNYGRVKNHKGRITEGHKHESGYLWVSISPNQYLLHRLVAKVFIPNPENKQQVNHIDGNKANACVSNLEWVSCKENSQHSHNTGLNPTKKSIIQYDLDMNKIKEFNSQKEASIQLNINHQDINKCCKNKNKSAGGFIFKYSTDINLIDNVYSYSNLSNTKKIIQYDLQMNKIKEFNSQKEASKQLNISYTSINKCCLNKQKTAGRFIFKFVE